MYLLAALAWGPLAGAFNDDWRGDPAIYRDDANAILRGQMPYRDVTIEYPPYAVPIFLAPRLFGNDAYLGGFMILTAACELLIRGALFWVGMRLAGSPRRWLPLACYIIAVPFLRPFLLQRYDLWPALISVAAALMFRGNRLFWAGLLVAIGAGVKVYPALFIPPLFILLLRLSEVSRSATVPVALAGVSPANSAPLRNHKTSFPRHFLLGLASGFAPLALLSFVMPWWRFAAFQGSRGLQAESLFASAIWGLHRLGLAETKWLYVFRWFEVQGPMASALLPWARAAFALAVLASVAMACLAAKCTNASLPLGRLSRLLLLPLLAFVAFNQVLSPQYMIWLLPLAALAILEGSLWAPLATTLATMLTPIIFPSFDGDYGRGLNGWETAVLVLRNLLLVAAWWMILAEHWRLWRNPTP